MFRTCSGLRHTAGASVVVLLLAACRPDATAPMASIATEARQFVSGASLTVSNTNATGRGSLSEALANAQRGDKIVFAEKLAGQTIPLAATIETTMALHFEGPVAGNVILDAGGQFRVWHNASGLDTVVIRRVTLRGGTTSAAGTILQTSGGGLMVDEGQVICERCVFTENSAQYGGGVAVLNFGKLDARLSRAMRNTAVMAGGIGTGFGELKLTRSRVDSNSATLTGGGLQLRGATEIDRSTIMFNRAAGSGAGLQVREGVFRMRNSAVTYNDASIGANIIGAGMTVETGADVRLDHVAIFDNDPRASFGSAINTIVPITVANSYLGGTPVSCNDPTKIVHAGRNGVFDTSCGAAGPRVLVTNPFILYPTIEQDLQTVYRLRTDSPLIDAGLDCTLTEDQLGLTRTVGASCDIGPVEYNTFPTAPLAIAASATVSRISGAVQLGGTITCTGAGSVSLAVGLEQMQKIGKSSNTVSGNSTTTAVCANGTVSWSTVVVPSSGGFTSGSGSATVRATGGTALPAAAAGSVKLGWSR